MCNQQSKLEQKRTAKNKKSIILSLVWKDLKEVTFEYF